MCHHVRRHKSRIRARPALLADHQHFSLGPGPGSFVFPTIHKEHESDPRVVAPASRAQACWTCTHTQHMLDMFDLHQITCTPAVAPVPLQSGLWHRTSCAKCNTWEPGASDPPCLPSGFVVFSRLLSINFLRTVISGNSLKQYAVSHTAVAHDLSRYRELHFLRQNHVARIIPTFTLVSADPWRRNVV